MTEQEIKYIQIDEEKVRNWLEENKERIEKSSKHVGLSAWLLGKIIAEGTHDWNKNEISFLYTLIEKEIGLTRSYLRQCKHFYQKFPDLPLIVQKYDLPQRFWLEVSKYTVPSDEILRWVDNNYELMKGMRYIDLIRQFKDWFGYRIPTRDEWCAVCEVELKEEDKDRTWRFVPVCDNCMNEIKRLQDEFLKKIEEYRDLIKEKDLKIKNLYKLMEAQDRVISDLKKILRKHGLKYE